MPSAHSRDSSVVDMYRVAADRRSAVSHVGDRSWGYTPPASESRNPAVMSDKLWRQASAARAIRSSIYRCEPLGDLLA
jgi:hypothetical protein